MEANQMQELFIFNDLEKFIFFNINDKGILKKVEGAYKRIFNNNSFLISQNDDLDSIIMAQSRNESLKIFGEEYNNIYISYIPAKELSYLEIHKNSYSNNEITKELNKNYRMSFEKVFALIEKPLLKISKNEKDKDYLKSNDDDEDQKDLLDCVLSGRRSSIIFSEDNFAIRLKGSGNNFNGFQLGEVLDIAKNHFEVFGCQFKNTCLREQFVCAYINEKLKDYNFICGNVPIGYWRYENSFLEKLSDEKKLNEEILANLKNEAKSIDKYCGLFVTAGEKRLGHHFFNGFSYILDKFIENEQAFAQIMNFVDNDYFKKALEQRKKENPEGTHTEAPDEIQYTLNETAFEVNPPDSNYNNLFDLLSNLILNSEPNLIQEAFKASEKLILNFIAEFLKQQSELGHKHFNESLKNKTLEILISIEDYLKSNNLNLFTCLILLFSQIAFECGLIKKCLEKNELIWGTYEFHCNAHLDNLLLIKKNKNCRLLSPIDFDLAYYKKEFIDIKYKDLKGIEVQVGFDDLMLREKNYLLIQLLGINPIPNIDVDIPYFRNKLEKLQEEKKNAKLKSEFEKKLKYLENLENLIKENVSLYYSKGFNECKESETIFTKYYDINYMMMELLLILEALK